MSHADASITEKYRYAILPLTFFVTCVLMCLASMQLGGRLVMHFAANLTPQINTVLSPWNVQIVGLEGSWQGLNPVLRIDQFIFAAGQIDDLEVEIDGFRSLMNGAWLPHRLTWSKAQARLLNTSSGWQLENTVLRELPFDLNMLLLGSHFTQGELALKFTDPGNPPATLQIQIEGARGASASRVLALALSFDAADKTSAQPPAQMTVQVTQRQSRQAHSYPEIYLSLAGDLELPSFLSGGRPLTISVSDGYWATHDEFGAGGGQLAIMLADYEPLTAGAARVPAARLDVRLSQEQQVINGLLSNLEISSASEALQLRPIRLMLQTDVLAQIVAGETPTHPFFSAVDTAWLRLHIPGIDLGRLTSLANEILVADSIAGRWISQLDADGSLSDLQAFILSDFSLGYGARVANLDVDAFRGVPKLRGGSATVVGNDRSVIFNVQGEQARLQFPTILREDFLFDRLAGQLHLFFMPGYIALRGQNIIAQRGETSLQGDFATTRPDEVYEQRASVYLRADRTNAVQAKSYIPYDLSSGLKAWLLDAPQTGEFTNLQLAYQGQIHIPATAEAARRTELTGMFSDSFVQYATGWPQLKGANGTIHVAGPVSYAKLLDGSVLGIDASATSVTVLSRENVVAIEASTQADAGLVLDLIRQSPLHENLRFVDLDWAGSGMLDIAAQVAIPIGTQESSADVDELLRADLAINYRDLSLSMPGYRVAFAGLSGEHRFSLPHHLNGRAKGYLFDEPVAMSSTSSEQLLWFDLDGSLNAKGIYSVLGLDDFGALQGRTDFSAKLSLPQTEQSVPVLNVCTDLRGLEISLPGFLGKSQERSLDSNFQLQMFPDLQNFAMRYGNTEGWMHFAGDTVSSLVRGGIGINSLPPEINDSSSELVIRGHVNTLDVADWFGESDAIGLSLPIEWSITGLTADKLIVGDLDFDDVVVLGSGADGWTRFEMDSEALAGSVNWQGDSPLQFNLDRLHLPGGDADAVADPATELRTPSAASNTALDPIGLDVGRSLIRADVKVRELILADEPFGSWDFSMFPRGRVVDFQLHKVDVNGVHIQGSKMFWDLQDNRSGFEGEIVLDDLEQTLPLWGFDPSLSTEEAIMEARLGWQGSPANVSFEQSQGSFTFAASNGRFFDRDVGPRGLRMVSLLNVSTLAKRISLDFSDVVGNGISFSKLFGEFQISDQELSFSKNLVIKSTSSTYELGGVVDLRNGELDNQMIVTLPVSESLPWYAAYVALANPIAGLGVAIGERVLRQPIQAMSSAKFSVTGKLTAPEVKLINIWDNNILEASVIPEQRQETIEDKSP